MTTSVVGNKQISNLTSLTTPNGNTVVVVNHTNNSVTNTYQLSLSILFSNAGINTTANVGTFSTIVVGNSTVNTIINSTSIAIGSIVSVNTSVVFLGNSTVNTSINSSSFSTSGNVQTNNITITTNTTANVITISGQSIHTIQTLSDSANISWDCSSGAKAKVTLAGDRNFDPVNNAIEGASYVLWIIQDSGGSRVPTFTTSGSGSFDFGSEGAPTLSTTANTADVLGFEAISIGGTLKMRYVGCKKGYS